MDTGAIDKSDVAGRSFGTAHQRNTGTDRAVKNGR